MYFLSMVIACLAQQKLDLPLSLRFDDFLAGLFRRFANKPNKSTDLIYLLILLHTCVALVCFVVMLFIGQFLWGTGALAIQVLVLLCLLGAGGYRELLHGYSESWGRGDMQGATYKARMLGALLPVHQDVSAEGVHQATSRAFLDHLYQRFFSVLFWFFIAGPAGGLIVRLNQHLASKSYGTLAESAGALNHLIDWLPSRLLVMTFAMGGNFTGCFKQAGAMLRDPSADSGTLIFAGACGALGQQAPDQLNGKGLVAISAGQASLEALRGLTNRSLAIWMAGFALIAIVLA